MADPADAVPRFEAEATHPAWDASAPEPRASPARLARHLLDVGLITAADVHRHGLHAHDAGMSHAVAVVRMGERGFVVKELLDPPEGSQGTPQQERAVYRLASAHAGLTPFVAPVIHLGDGSPYLVLDLRADGESVAARAQRTGWSDGQLARHLGLALGEWHERSRPLATELQPTPLPWVVRALDEDRPAFLRSNALVAGHLERVRALALHPVLVETQRRWRPSGVVHGDLRFDNCLVNPAGAITFVDWEFGGRGDPIWDLATLAQELLSASSARDGASCAPVLTGSVRLLIRSYRAACPSEPWGPDAGERLIGFTAARLLQRSLQLAARGAAEVDAERDRHLELARVLFLEPSAGAAIGTTLSEAVAA